MLSREDVVRMAQDAGFVFFAPEDDGEGIDWSSDYTAELERFAALVAAATRKTCEVACAQAILYAKDAEREAILSEIETGIWLDKTTEEVLAEIAAAIRARGEKGGA